MENLKGFFGDLKKRENKMGSRVVENEKQGKNFLYIQRRGRSW